MSRCDSAAMVPKTSEDLPDPETPVKTVIARFGMSTETSRRLFSRAPRTSMWSRSRIARRYRAGGGRSGTRPLPPRPAYTERRTVTRSLLTTIASASPLPVTSAKNVPRDP
jgi:hypothetical protein